MIIQVKVVKLVMGKDMGLFRFSLQDRPLDDTWRIRWLRQVIVPRNDR